MKVDAREVAARVLVRVEREKAFAAAALDAELARAAQLEPRDRALATELVYGTLRAQAWLRAQIAEETSRGAKKLEPRARAHLDLAAYQIFFMARVPAFAAVSAAVEGVKRAAGPRVAGFANAVLRKLAARAPENDQTRAALLEQAIVASTPPWLEAALARALGDEGARAFVRAGIEPPAVCLRLERAEEREGWIARLRAAAPHATFEPGRVSPHAVLVRGAGKPQELPGFREGAWSVQEEGSQVVALALGARPGDRVLDACAGRGNKSAILARAVAPGGALDAADLHPSKLERLREELARVGLAPRATFAVDWSVGAGEATGPYDRVIVDAPCSGTGTLRRRPELLARREAADLAGLAGLQRAIAARASAFLRPGGRLIYAVCSVLREEAEEVVAALLAERPELAPAPFEGAAARGLAADATSLRLLPHVHGTDGYFLASFVARA